MKKAIIFLLLIITSIGQSQNENTAEIVKTSLNEYNFLTTVLSQKDGENFLEGYELKQFHEATIDNYNLKYRLFIEKESGKVKAISVKTTKYKKKEDKIRFICIPFNNEALKVKYKEDCGNIGISTYGVLLQENFLLFQKLLDEKYNAN